MEYVYRARIEADPHGGYLVTFPDVPEATTAGGDEVDARANAAEALGTALRGYAAHQRPLPVPVEKGDGLVPVAVEAATAMKLAVISAFREAKISKTELGRRLNKVETEARRILDPDHPTKLASLEAALAALGKEAVISVRDAA